MTIRISWFLLILVFVGACDARTGQIEVGESSAELSAAGLTPVPCKEAADGWETTWRGTFSQLLLADALGACGYSSKDFDNEDAVLNDVIRLMGGDADDWVARRDRNDDQFSNCARGGDPNLKANRSGFVIEPSEVPGLGDVDSEAEDQLTFPSLQLCLAMHLRTAFPGTAAGDALFLEADEIRELLSTIQDRAQVAMVHAALSGSLFSASTSSDDIEKALRSQGSSGLNFKLPVRLTELLGASKDTDADRKRAFAADFAAAIRLHTTVTSELVELFGRSSSAKAPRGGAPGTTAEATWGDGSWLMRTTLLLYGGDPLAIGPNGPWTHPLRYEGPASTEFQDGPISDPDAEQLYAAWPGRELFPYVDLRINEPQVFQFIQLARKLDVLEFPAVTDNSGCVSLGEAPDLYEAVEVATRNAVCAERDLAGECVTVTVPPPNLGDYLVNQLYGLRPHHGRRAVDLLQESIGSRLNCDRDGARVIAGDLVLDVAGSSIRLADDFALESHSTEQLSGGFTRYAPITLATPSMIDSLIQGIIRDIAVNPLAVRSVPTHFLGFASSEMCLWLRMIDPKDFETEFPEDPRPGPIDQGPVITPFDAQYQFVCDSTGSPFGAEQQRVMGAIPALSATRWLIAHQIAAASSGDYQEHATTLLKLIGAYAGTSVALQPQLVQNPTWSPTSKSRPLELEERDGGAVFNVDVVPHGTDAFWKLTGDEELEVLVVRDEEFATDLIRFPKSRIMGRDVGDVLQAGLSRAGVMQSTALGEGAELLRAQVTIEPDEGPWAIVAWKRLPADRGCGLEGCSEPGGELRLLAGHVHLASTQPESWEGVGAYFEPTSGQYFGGPTGSLSMVLDKALEPSPVQPSEPHYDGFGFPRHMVPPYSSALSSSGSKLPGFRHYISRAREAASAAADAVDNALSSLLEQQVDESSLRAEQETIAQDVLSEAETLCGSGNAANCSEEELEKIATTSEPLDGDLLSAIPEFEAEQTDTSQEDYITRTGCETSAFSTEQHIAAKQKLNCIAYELVDELIASAVRVAQPVLDALGVSIPPTFNEYGGGKLEFALSAQHAALTQMNGDLKGYFASLKTSKRQIDSAMEAVMNMSATLVDQCEGWDHFRSRMGGAFSGAVLGASIGASIGSVFPVIGNAVGAVVGAAIGAIVGFFTSDDLEETCNAYFDQLDVLVVVASNTMVRSAADAMSGAASVVDRRADAVQSGIAIDQLMAQTQIVMAQLALEAELAGSDGVTSFGLYRRYHAYDLLHARALVSSARRHALLARRAVEAYFVVDLDELTAPEALVAAPAVWANDIYEYDLSLPSAVGLSATREDAQVGGGIYSNALVDYVESLSSFADGFSMNRPSGVAREDLHVVTLPGPQPTEFDFTFEFEPGVEVERHVEVYESNWQLLCQAASGDFWAPLAAPRGESGYCGNSDATPVRARLVFQLDQLGQLLGTVPRAFDDPDPRYNMRLDRVAVVLVGIGIRDCAPYDFDCAAETYLRFDLRHEATALLRDHAGEWRHFEIPRGVIEGGKAVAVERPVDVFEDGWNTEYLSGASRTEFSERSVGGRYMLDLELTPDIRLDRLEKVEFVIGASHWVSNP